MEKAPKVGTKVRYAGDWNTMRGVTGTVTKLYQEHDDVFDDDGEFVRAGPLLPPRDWKAAVRVDAKPKDWPYAGHDEFCPSVSELQPI